MLLSIPDKMCEKFHVDPFSSLAVRAEQTNERTRFRIYNISKDYSYVDFIF